MNEMTIRCLLHLQTNTVHIHNVTDRQTIQSLTRVSKGILIITAQYLDAATWFAPTSEISFWQTRYILWKGWLSWKM